MASAADAPIFQAHTAIPAGDLPSTSRAEMPARIWVGVLTAPAERCAHKVQTLLPHPIPSDLRNGGRRLG
jgi:hypothetical protein